MTKITFSIILLFTLFSTFNINAQIPAFPGAEGYAKYSVGGRGGQVIRVTNLNDSGPGSLREACAANGPRTVIFDVGGRINLSSTIRIENPYITIAGQHSVGDGITLSMEGTPNKFLMLVATNDVIIRYITFRRSSEKVSSQNSDCLYIASGSNNIMVDHCSFSWASDENLSMADYGNDNETKGCTNITIQYCMFTNAYGGNNKSNLVSGGASEITWWRNAWVSVATRNPSVSTPVEDAPNYDSYFEIANNFYYDVLNGPSFNVNDLTAGKFYANVINNHSTKKTGSTLGRRFMRFGGDNETRIYVEGNITPFRPTDDLDEWEIGQFGGGSSSNEIPVPENRRSYTIIQTPLVTENVTLWNPIEIWENLKHTVGASLPTRDSEDLRAFNSVENGTATENNTINVFPIINNGIPLEDLDSDGIPDFWEILEYGDLSSDGFIDTDGDGYTDLEEYLNQTANGQIPEILAENVIVTPNTATLNVPETITVSSIFIPANTTNKSGVWSSSDPTIATVDATGLITSVSEGIAIITFTSNSGGFTDSVEVTVTNIIIPLESVSLNPSTVTLEIGETSAITATLTPTNTTDITGTWTSTDETIATVDENGLVTGTSEGQATIIYTDNNTNLSDNTNVTVVDTFFGTYDFYNASTDVIIQSIFGDTDINLENEGNEINFRVIPEGGDTNEEVESVRVDWTGPTSGTWTESSPIYAALPGGHVDLNFEPYVVEEGTYDFTITYYTEDGASGDVVAVDTFSLTFFFSSLPVANAGPDQSICEGETTTLTASGGPNFLWNTGETTASIDANPLIETTYTVTVSDNEGNSDQDSVTVTVNSFPVANAGEDQTICEGESITLTAVGGTSYLWSTGETTDSIVVNPTTETTYDLEVTSNGCSSTDSVTIFVNAAPAITVTEDLFIIEGNSTILTASGSDNYQWNTGETTESITVTPIATTTYSVSSLNTNGCARTVEVIVTVIPQVVANAGNDLTICNGDSVTLNATGGVTYIWDTGDTSAELIVNPTETTTYTVTAEDAYGNTDTDSVIVTVNELPNIVVDENSYIFEGDSTTLNVSGGDTYSWDTGETSDSIIVSPIVTTTYSVTAFSANGCQITAEIVVTVIEELNANAGEDVSICIGDDVTLNATGGITYTWNTGSTSASPTFSPTETTTYTVTVTDGFGNSDSDDVTVFVNALPTANAGENQTVCEGDEIVLTAEGGDTYLWDTGATTASIIVNPTESTTYTVEVFNSGSCSDSDDVTVFVNESPDLTISDDIIIVSGNSTILSATGADSYSWNTGEISASIVVSPIISTTYTVVGSSANGCETSRQVTVVVVPEVIANAGADATICSGESITLNASGGVSYLWSNGSISGSPIVSPTQTTTYTVTVSDNFGNSDTDSVTITVNESPNVAVTQDVTIIVGESINLVVNGAESYLWSTGETSNSITVNPTQTTTYTVIGTTNSCSMEVEVTVTVEELFQASAGEDQQVCENDAYDIVLTANQGDSYLWNTGDTTQSITVSPLSTSTYTVTITNGSQQDTDNVTIYVDPNPNVVIANGDSVDIMDGDFVTLSASGANTYEWNNGATQPNIAVSPSITTTYAVKGYVNDCYDEKQVTVNVVPEVIADAGEDVVICLGDIATLTAAGGEDYVWSTGETTQTIQVSPAETTEYTVTVFNALDFDEDTVVVEVDADCEEGTEVPGNEDQDFAFEVFPNPASEVVNVKLSGSDILTNVYLYDITGKLIHKARIVNDSLSNSSITQIDVSTLQPGMYYIKLFDVNRGELSKKIIVN